MPDFDSRNNHYSQPQKYQNRGRAQVRLKKNQGSRNKHINSGNNNMTNAVKFDMAQRKILRQNQNHYQFYEFHRLEIERPDSEPTRRSPHLSAENQNSKQKQNA